MAMSKSSYTYNRKTWEDAVRLNLWFLVETNTILVFDFDVCFTLWKILFSFVRFFNLLLNG